MSAAVLRRRVTFELVPGGDRGRPVVPVCVVLTYDPVDPYVIRASFTVGKNRTVVWDFSRELLGAGLIEPAGVGDITVAPMVDRPDRVELELSSPTGAALFAAPAGALWGFLAQTYALVPAGTELDDVDLDPIVDGWLTAVLERDLGVRGLDAGEPVEGVRGRSA